jgi:small-conductance mechanosensitive channel
MSMNSTMGRVRSADWAAESPVERPSLRKRASGGFTRVVIAFCIGISATLAWQSYGDAVREIIASRYPQFAWLAPHAPAAPPASAATVPPVVSADPQELKTMSLGLAAVRQRVDQLTASQDQTIRDLTMKLQAAKQEILDRMSMLSPQSATPLARKPAPPAPLH